MYERVTFTNKMNKTERENIDQVIIDQIING